MDGAYLTRIGATCVAAALLGVMIAKPDAGRRYAEKAAALKPEPKVMAPRACASGEAVLKSAFAPIDDVLSVSPLGGVTAPGETLPAPTIRINTKKGATVFERRRTTALAPSRGEITAIERHQSRKADGTVEKVRWTVHFAPCENVALYFDDLDDVAPGIVKAAGGLVAFEELGGPDHLAIKTSIRIREGEEIGAADGFDVGLIDFKASESNAARPERYKPAPYAHATAFDASPELLKAISMDASKARCPLDYLPREMKAEWSSKLGDAWGMRRARGEDACRTAVADIAETAQGAWFTDASHNGVTSKVSAIALAPDAVDPQRQIFALHGRLRSLTAEMVGLNPMLTEEREAAARDFLSFDSGLNGANTPFSLVKEGEIYCYDGLRANFVGPRINGVILLEANNEEGATLMQMEARSDYVSCADLPEPWAFSGNETTFYR